MSTAGRGEELEALRERARGIWRAGLAAADPRAAVARVLNQRPFEVDSAIDTGAGSSNPSAGWDLLALGKAAGAMTAAALEGVLGPGPSRVLVVTDAAQREATDEALSTLAPELGESLRVVGGGHPLPTRESERAASAAEELVAPSSSLASPSRPLLVLVSGGGSALVAAPADGLTLEDKIETTALLQTAAGDIGELNCVRRHLSRTKGGGLGRLALSGALRTVSRAAAPAARRVRVLVLSDVLGDALEDIASGPFYGDPTSFADAEAACRRLGTWAELPGRVADRLAAGARGELDENPTPSELSSIEHEIVGSLRVSVEAAVGAARRDGLSVSRFPEWITGEAREAGAALVDRVATAAEASVSPGRSTSLERASAWIGGGETVVTVVGDGVGGRAQELALGFAAAAERRLPGPWVLLSAGTDGRDGPGEAAGALVDSGTLERARRSGFDVGAALADNDASSFLRASGDLLVTGRTGTNVGDLAVLLVGG